MPKAENINATADEATAAPDVAEDEVRDHDDFDDRPRGSHRRIFDDVEDGSEQVRRRLRSRTDEVLDRADEAIDRSSRYFDEGQSIAKALTVGYLTQLQLLGEVATSFATSVLDGTLAEEEEDPDAPPRKRPGARPGSNGHAQNGNGAGGDRRYRWEQIPDVFGDVTDGLLEAFDSAVDIPRRAFDDAYDSYDRTRSRRPRR
jgi:hypothetical protein